MIALIAISFAFFVGIIGLGVDVGFLVMHQRILKNASDAAATAGAIRLPENESLIQTDVDTLLTRHSLPAGTTATCDIVNVSNVVVQTGCAPGVPNGSAGVQVVLEYTRPTFLMKIVGTQNMTARTRSIAKVMTETSYDTGAALFAVCGWNTPLAGGGSRHILAGSPPGTSPWPADAAAVGSNFFVHGPSGVAQCGMGDASFKGLILDSGYTSVPGPITYDPGQITGPTTVAVQTRGGCPAGSDPNNCIMILPVVTQPPVNEPQHIFYAVRWLPFLITSQANGTKHNARLMGTSAVVAHDPGSGTGTWSKGGTGDLLSVRLAD